MWKIRLTNILGLWVVISGFLYPSEEMRILINVISGLIILNISLLTFFETKKISSLISTIVGGWIFCSVFITPIISNSSNFIINNFISGVFVNSSSAVCLLKTLKFKNSIKK